MNKKLLIACILCCAAIQTASASVLQYNPDYVVSNYAQTKYPILLVHGWGLGFSRVGTQYFGLDQFYQIAPDLARNGASVFAATLSTMNSTEIRGEQLLQQVDDVIALTGKPKVNLIGHSHGGPTIQYIEAVAPEKVASMTAVAGAMKGTQVANSLKNSGLFNIAVNIVMSNLIAPMIQIGEGDPSLPIDYNASVNSLTFEGAAAFNAKYPTAAISKDCNSSGQKITSNGIAHYSWMGSAQITNVLDPDTVIEGASSILMGTNQGPHDGLVSTCSGNYGQVIRNDYNWNHFDEVNQILGLKAWNAQDPVAVFRQHANRLKLQGL